MRELFVTCLGKIIDWRRIVMAGAIMTVVGIFLPNVMVLRRPDIWHLPGSLGTDFNGIVNVIEFMNESRIVHLTEDINKARHDDQSNLLRVGSVASMNVSTDYTELSTIEEEIPAVYKNVTAESGKTVNVLKQEKKSKSCILLRLPRIVISGDVFLLLFYHLLLLLPLPEEIVVYSDTHGPYPPTRHSYMQKRRWNVLQWLQMIVICMPHYLEMFRSSKGATS